MSLWFLAPELLAEIKISKDQTGNYRVCSHPLDKPKRANPEEIIRQLVLVQLRYFYKYPHDKLLQEYVVKMGIAKKRADVVVKNDQGNAEIIIELKQSINEESILQLQSYMIATGARFGAVISLHSRKAFSRNQSGQFLQIQDLPMYQGEIHVDNANIDYESHVICTTAISLMEALCITEVVRLSSVASYLYIKGKRLKLSNSSLLDYNSVRRHAIQEGIILPSTVKKEDWDEVLKHLFDKATNAEALNSARTSPQPFDVCLEITHNHNDHEKFGDLYTHYVKWWGEYMSGGNSKPQSKKAFAKYLKTDKGLECDHSNGRRYLGIKIIDKCRFSEK